MPDHPLQPIDSFRFELGQLVLHQRYGYRGAVFGRDAVCQADDAWYESNLTQPDREQPWYHVMVHGARHTTYVAEENLAEDRGGEQVVHPLARRLFKYFQQGRYVPHDKPLKLF